MNFDKESNSRGVCVGGGGYFFIGHVYRWGVGDRVCCAGMDVNI